MKLIYLIAGTYRPAGMERVLAGKANWLTAQGNEVVIVTTDQRGQMSAFEMDPSIRRIDLDINYEENNGGSFASKLLHYPGKQIRHKKALKALLFKEKADIVVSMFCNDAAFVPKIKDGSRKVLEIHFSRFKRLQYGRKGLWAIADWFRSWNDRRVASRFDRFVVLTHEDRQFWGNMDNIRVIPNARTFTCAEPSSLDGRQVIAVGRYCYQKAMDRLVEAWGLIEDRDGWTLRIAGDGEDRAMLEEKIKEAGLEGSVVLGPCKDMLSEYMKSSVFALSSRYEGLPMVLLEAQATGIPIVAFDCKCGPRDVVTDGVDGFIVPEGDVKALAARIETLIKDDALRRQMGQAAFRASDRFDEEKIMNQWKEMFEELL